MDRRSAAIDVGLYVAAAFILLAIERGIERIGLLPSADIFRGAPTLIASLFVAIALQRRHHRSLRDLGLRRLARWWTLPAWGLAVLVVSVVLHLVIVPGLAYLLGAPEPDFSRYDAIVGNLPLFIFTALGAMFTGGFIEEVIYRGFLIDRLEQIIGGGRGSAAAAALLSGLVFGLIHFEWGIGGIVSTAALGAGLGFMFLATKRNLWPLIAAHATLDLVLLSQLYLGVLE